MALYHKCDVKNGFAYVLTFFSLISDSLGSVASNIEISRSDLHDITKRTTMISTDVFITDSGTYECRYGSSLADPISMPMIVTVLAGK
jgi:hypothetical protein